MNRRSFLSRVASASTCLAFPTSLTAHLAEPPRAQALRIANLEVIRLKGRMEEPEGLNHQHQVQPLHLYPEHRPAPYRDRPTGNTRSFDKHGYYLRISTEDGHDGLYGAIDWDTVPVLLSQLRRFLIGKDALAIETLWDKMYRSNRHSRAGHYMMAISAVDNALWDLRGKYLGQPVYRLLGGPTRDRVEVYGSCLGFSVELDAAAAKSASLKTQGFRHQKWFLSRGPGDGAEGLQQDVELVQTLRKSVGPEVRLMFDAFMGWDLPYAVRWAKAVEPYHPYWIEEAFPPDRPVTFAALRRQTTIPVASGEHFYSRWEVDQFIDRQALDIIQADPEWCGGVSELVKICHLASANDLKVFPHGHGIHAALHVVASQSPAVCPLVEYLLRWMPHKVYFEKAPPVTQDGFIPLPQRPGFGIEFEEAKIVEQTTLTQL